MEYLHSIIIGEGDPLLILHGFFGMGDNWKSLGNKFSEHYQVHLIDQRNHGRSFHTNEFNYELMVDDLKSYIAFHKLNQVNVMGHSMGGKTAMLFAVTYPQIVKKLIVADIAPKFYPAHHQFILKALHAVDFSQVKTRNDIDTIFKEYIPEIGIRQFLLKNVFRKSDNSFAYRFNLESLTNNIEEIGAELPAISQFDGEVLFLKGGNSGYIGSDDEDLIHAHFPNSKLEIISNAGHWLHAENPTDFFAKANDFLRK